MTGITTGIGLMSGIDTATLINQLIAIESRPKILAMSRQTKLKAEQSAFLGLNSILLSLQSAAARFATDRVFQSKSATSSDPSILTATAATGAQPGVYDFIVDRLVTTSQHLSRGFSDRDSTPLGLTQISFEFGKGRLETDATLASLNAGDGVARGKIRVTDSSGASAVIDLSKAVSLGEVLDAINDDTTLQVAASINSAGTGLLITDTAGGAGTMTVENVTGYVTATELGIAGSAVDGKIVGSAIHGLTFDTALSTLNDGNGVRINRGQDITDFRIRTRDGAVHDITLGKITVGEGSEDRVTTLKGVKERIEEITGSDVTVSLGEDGQSIVLTDNTIGILTFEVTAGTLGATEAAIDLGIFKQADIGTPDTIGGDKVLAALNSVLTRSLNGGKGLDGATALTITDRDGNSDTFTINPNSSISDIIALINASEEIAVTASLNRSGNGVRITDTSGGSNNLIIEGNAAEALGIATDPAGVEGNEVQGTNLQLQYVSSATRLSDLNYGRGVANGSFRIWDGMGHQALIEVNANTRTLQDVIEVINSRDIDVRARINDTGDGLIIENTAETPVHAIRVETASGTTARDLNILGTAAGIEEEENFINGSYERVVNLEETDTLQEVVQKINAKGIPVSASIINNGAGQFFMQLTSRLTGTAGDLIIDSGGVDLGLNVLAEAQDAVVFFGSTDPARAMLITSTTNTLDNVLSGVKIDLKGSSESPVRVTVADDTDKKIEAVRGFISAFNAAVRRLNDLDKFDRETEQRGPLLGNPTVARIRSQLFRMVQGPALGVETRFQALVEVGVRVGKGSLLELNEDRLRSALAEDPEAVANVFAARKLAPSQKIDIGEGVTIDSPDPIYESLGVAERLNQLVRGMTNSIDGTLTRVRQNYDRQIQLLDRRIAAFDSRLESRRKVLERQFTAMENALASLQSQAAALSGIASVGFLQPRT